MDNVNEKKLIEQGMGNSKLKKKKVEVFNNKRKVRLALEQNKANNPEKYAPKISKSALRHPKFWDTIALLTQKG